LIFITQSNGGGVILLSEFTGERIGHLPVLDQIAVTPALRAGTLFVAAGNRLYAFELSDFLDQPTLQSPVPAWAFECAGEAIVQPLLVDERAVYLLARNDQEAILESVSQVSGKQLWPEPLRFETPLTAPPVMVRDRIVIITYAGDVSVVQAATGELEQTFSLNRRIDSQVAPFVVDNRVLLSDPHGYVFELVLDQSGASINLLYDHRARISSIAANSKFIALGHMAGLTLLSSRGNLLWSSDTLESVSSTPIVTGESVFALDDAGNGLLFDVLKSNPMARVKLFGGDVSASPLLTSSHLVAVNGDGKVAVIGWN
jgi:outer membrane protein assembly factor BamB